MSRQKTLWNCLRFAEYLDGSHGNEGGAAILHLNECAHCTDVYLDKKQRTVRLWERLNRSARQILTTELEIHRNHCLLCQVFTTGKDREEVERFFNRITTRIIEHLAVFEGREDTPPFDEAYDLYIRKGTDNAHAEIRALQIN